MLKIQARVDEVSCCVPKKTEYAGVISTNAKPNTHPMCLIFQNLYMPKPNAFYNDNASIDTKVFPVNVTIERGEKKGDGEYS